MRFCIMNICMSAELLENPVTLSIIIILRCLTKYRLKLSFGAEANVCIFKKNSKQIYWIYLMNKNAWE